MADQSVPTSKPADAVEDDPIDVIQRRVYHAKALCKAVADASESVSTYENDLQSALLGIVDILDGIHLKLDPGVFRALVLASEAQEVAHG